MIPMKIELTPIELEEALLDYLNRRLGGGFINSKVTINRMRSKGHTIAVMGKDGWCDKTVRLDLEVFEEEADDDEG